MKLGTKERLQLFGQIVAIGFVISLVLLLVLGLLSIESVVVALVANFIIVGLIFLILGNHR